MKDNGSGYPEEKDKPKAGSSNLPSSALIGDGGASWRLKALKRAKEQAARDGKRIEEVRSLVFNTLLILTARGVLLSI